MATPDAVRSAFACEVLSIATSTKASASSPRAMWSGIAAWLGSSTLNAVLSGIARFARAA